MGCINQLHIYMDIHNIVLLGKYRGRLAINMYKLCLIILPLLTGGI